MALVTLEQTTTAEGQPLFVEFVNTLHWYEGAPVELVGTEADLAAWAIEHHLPLEDVTGCLPGVHELREHLRAVTSALASGESVPEADMARVQGALSAPVGSLRLDSAAQLSLLTAADDAVVFSFRVALSLALFLRSPQRRRLKLCANPGCGFAFVDTSINATRRWCYMRYCGNRLKVRAFRSRKVQAPAR